jgi:hypothetical protein
VPQSCAVMMCNSGSRLTLRWYSCRALPVE